MAGMNQVRQAILDAGVRTEGHFVFADGAHATTKMEMDRLFESPKQLDVVLHALASYPLERAEVMLGVPTGGQRLAEELTGRGLVPVPISNLERIPGGKKQDFRFRTPEDEARARSARTVRIYEDVVTTLSSIAGVVRLLKPEHQEIHSLAIWRRGTPLPHYRHGVRDHYLIEEELPNYPPETCPICSH